MSHRMAYVCLGAILCALLVSACTGFAAPPKDQKPPPGTLSVSSRMMSGVDPKDMKALMKVWMHHTNEQDGYTSVSEDLRIFSDEEEMRKAVEKQEPRCVFVALALDYIRLRDLGLVGKDNAAGTSGNVMDEYVVLVPRDGDIKDLKGLKQKKVIVQVGGLGEVPTIWLDTILMKEGMQIASQFCREVKLVPKASAAVFPVFFGQADACVAVKKAFMTMAELNPQIGKRLTMLAQSEGFMRSVSWFSRDWSKQDIESSRIRLLEGNKDPAGRQLMTIMGYESIVIWDSASLVPLEALLKDYEKLSEKAKEKEDAAQGDAAKPESAAAPVTVPETSGQTAPQPAKGK